MICKLCDGDSTATRHAPLCPNKGPLDVYRGAADEYRGGPAGEGCAGFLALVLIGLAWGVCHLFGWFGL